MPDNRGEVTDVLETHIGSGGAPRIALAGRPTPLLPADRLAIALDREPGTTWVKRDDLTSLGLGGNKVRKLEYVLADALAAGATHLVTGAGVQSTMARATAAAAAKAGLGCALVLDGAPPPNVSGNLLLDLLFGASVRFRDAADHNHLELLIEEMADELRSTGAVPYVVPVGASTALGSLGYVDAADEIDAQISGSPLVVLATGSAGTHAGLAAGFGDHERVLGVRIGTRDDLESRVAAIADATAERAGRLAPRGRPVLMHDQLGDGYGEHTDACHEAMTMAARTEGLILDPVYTGKAMAGLIAGCRDGRIAAERPLVFLHTGGAPGLFSTSHSDVVSRWLSRE